MLTEVTQLVNSTARIQRPWFGSKDCVPLWGGGARCVSSQPGREEASLHCVRSFLYGLVVVCQLSSCITQAPGCVGFSSGRVGA